MSERRTLRQIFKFGFRNETEVRDAYNDFINFVFEEFFKVVGAILLLSALQFSLSERESVFASSILAVGKFILALKVQALLHSIFSESMFDVIDYNNQKRGKITGYAATAAGFILVVSAFYLITVSVDFLVQEFGQMTDSQASPTDS